MSIRHNGLRATLLAAAAALLAPPVASAAPQGALTPADIMTLDDMRDVELSPDGRFALFTVTAQMATFGAPRSTIWIVAMDGKTPARRFIVSAGVDDHPRWSPDGRRIAFLSNRANPITGHSTGYAFHPERATSPDRAVEATPPPDPSTSAVASRQLWVIDRDGGEAVPLTALATDVADFAWSPDGRRVAFLSADRDTAPADPVVVDRAGPRTRAWILDLADGRARIVSPAAVNISALAWSPDARRLAVRAADTTTINDYFYHSRIAVLDPDSGTLGPALIEQAAGDPVWSADGGRIAASVIRTPGFIGLGVRVHDLARGSTVALADDHPGLVTNPSWSADGRALIALSFEQTRSNVVRIALADGRVTRIAALGGEATDVSTTRSGAIAVALSSPDRPADVWSVGKGEPRAVTRINPVVQQWKLGQVRQVSWKNGQDGRTVYGVLVTPPGYVPGTPIKTVVQIHGGPEWAWWSGWLGSWHEWAQLLATNGYAVFLPNPRGSDGQGTDFARTVGSDWGGMDFRDVMDGVDMLVAQKIADPARLGIGGWSYGGYLSAWAVTHSTRFKAAVVGAAPVDLGLMALATDTPDFTSGYFGAPSAALATLDRASPIRSLEAVTTPVLVLHGAEDTRVPALGGLAFYRGLKLLGKPVEMVRYPREPHWFHEPAHQEDLQRRVLAWFDRYL